MANKDPDRITDLARYRRNRERARKAAAQPTRRPAPSPAGRQPFLGSRPRAGVILVVVILVLAALWVLPGLF